ncbi:MAG: electron transport complex subunit RsxC [Thiobacillaceae bacterium]
MNRELFRFNGGLHLPDHKAESNTRPIHPPILPARLVISLRQHIGTPAKPIVSVGERVLKGQMIAAAEGIISAAVHASSSGTVRAIDLQTVPHASGLPDLCITIETDGLDQWVTRTPLDYHTLSPSEVRAQLRDLGLVGLGGAVFPGAVKLEVGTNGTYPTLILNGAECEPWITCDDVLMRHHAAEIMQGLSVMHHLLGSTDILIGIEDNKPEALAAMRGAAATLDVPVEVIAVPTRYPGGGAKQLIKTLTGKEVPSGKLSTDIGIQVFNVGTAFALYRAIFKGEPLISRMVTVSGHVQRPQNMEVLIGTPMVALIQSAGERDGRTGILMGGPMMGVPMPREDVPVVKATNCVLVKSDALFPSLPSALPCIRCTRCADACPADLQPQELFRFAKSDDFGRAQEYHLFDCIECGCCSYVCPSHIPLVDFYRYAKSEIWARTKEKTAADQARERHEFRLFRQTREKSEKADKLAARARTQRAASSPPDELASATAASADPEADAKKALIAAAIARAQAKKADAAPKNTDNLSAHTQQEIAEIEARRAKIRAAAHQPLEQEKTP